MVLREQKQMLVFVVDDQELPLEVVANLIEAIGGNIIVRRFRNAPEALLALDQVTPDLLCTDYRMPAMDGIELIQAFRALPNCRQVPVCMITSIDDRSVRIEALKAGATDFLVKPVDALEVQVRITNLLTLREQQVMLMDRAKFLEGRVVKKGIEVQKRSKDGYMVLARLAEKRDNETGQHLVRMAKYSRIVAENLSMVESECRLIENAAPLHDVGKLVIPETILLKPGKHSAEEWEVMKSHCMEGYDLLRYVSEDWEEMQLGAVIAKSHHEKWNGSGYPEGLRGKEIPKAARIIAVGDCFDALTSERPYKKAWSFQMAEDYLRSERKKHFDPECVDAFLSDKKKILEIHDRYADERIHSHASKTA